MRKGLEEPFKASGWAALKSPVLPEVRHCGREGHGPPLVMALVPSGSQRATHDTVSVGRMAPGTRLLQDPAVGTVWHPSLGVPDGPACWLAGWPGRCWPDVTWPPWPREEGIERGFVYISHDNSARRSSLRDACQAGGTGGPAELPLDATIISR